MKTLVSPFVALYWAIPAKPPEPKSSVVTDALLWCIGFFVFALLGVQFIRDFIPGDVFHGSAFTIGIGVGIILQAVGSLFYLWATQHKR